MLKGRTLLSSEHAENADIARRECGMDVIRATGLLAAVPGPRSSGECVPLLLCAEYDVVGECDGRAISRLGRVVVLQLVAMLTAQTLSSLVRCVDEMRWCAGISTCAVRSVCGKRVATGDFCCGSCTLR